MLPFGPSRDSMLALRVLLLVVASSGMMSDRPRQKVHAATTWPIVLGRDGDSILR